jgi:rSAM/selenodomain-associated transferase 2
LQRLLPRVVCPRVLLLHDTDLPLKYTVPVLERIHSPSIHIHALKQTRKATGAGVRDGLAGWTDRASLADRRPCVGTFPAFRRANVVMIVVRLVNSIRWYCGIIFDILFYGAVSAKQRISALVRRRTQSSLPSMKRLPGDAHIASDTLISVVIPAYNEGDSIGISVRSALSDNDAHVEVIVADGGSGDTTCAAASSAGAHTVLPSVASGRAACMNAGASTARGELLVFLHADSALPCGWARHVRDALSEPTVAIAAFTLALAPRVPGIGVIEHLANVRARRWQLPYGDQGLCLRADAFDALGRFPVQPLLEDVELVCEASTQGEVRILPLPVVSSSRRWQQFGLVGNSVLNNLVMLGRSAGVPVGRMLLWYYGASGLKQY